MPGQSYDIYIHAVNGNGGNAAPTTPWGQKEGGSPDFQTASQNGVSSLSGAGAGVARSIVYASAYGQNPDSLVSSAVGMMAKAMPIVAAAYAVVKLGDACISTSLDFHEVESGDYRGGNAYRDFKTTMHNIFTPFSSFMQNIRTLAQWERDSQRAKVEQELLGGSVANAYTRRGV